MIFTNRPHSWELVGDELDEAIAARERKQAYFEALDAKVPVIQNQDETGWTKIRRPPSARAVVRGPSG